MTKKILSQTLKHSKVLARKDQSEPQPSSWEKIKDFVVTLGAASGIIGGVLWVGGRFYAYGYFERMNIPLYFLSFSAGEYTEVYITTIFAKIFVFFATNILAIATAFVLAVVVGIILWVIQRRNKELRFREALLKIESINNKILIFSVILLFLASFFIAYSSGDASAQYILMNSRPIAIYSREVLPLETAPAASTSYQQSSLFEYKGLYLLTHNNGKYYLFRELDTATCKPKQIFIVADSDLISVNIGESVSLPKCSVTP